MNASSILRWAAFAAAVVVFPPGAVRHASAGETPPAGAKVEGPAPSPSMVLQGYRRFNGACSHCHGLGGGGSTFAPSLIDRPISPERFRKVVLEGSKTGASVMRGFAGDPNIVPYIDDIKAYLDARRQGLIGRGRPPER